MVELFEKIDSFSEIVHKKDEIAKKNTQVREAKAKNCGNCKKWMTSDCIPEKVNKQFKSCGSMACSDFDFSGQSFLDKCEKELIELQEELQDILKKKESTHE